MSSLPPAEKSRLEMMKRFSGLVARLATRMLPVVRNRIKRLTSKKGGISEGEKI